MMDFLNTILTFPGKLIANLLYDHLGIVWLIVLSAIIGLLAYHFLNKKREFFHIALILSSVLLAFTPSVFKFASYNSKLFWLFILSSAAIGFVYYFIDKDNSLTARIDSALTQKDEIAIPLNEATKESFLQKHGSIFLLVLIFALAFYLRTFQIEKYPEGYSVWELEKTTAVIKYDQGILNLKYYFSLFGIQQLSLNGSGLSNLSPIVMGLAIPFYKIFGISMVSARYYSILWGVSGLLFLFLYLREHFPMKSSIFLISLISVELVHVTFSRAGFYHVITSFTYTVLVLYLLEITFKQKRLYVSASLAFLLGLATFGSIYVYVPTRVIMLIAIVILSYKIMFRKAFLRQKMVPLLIFFLTFTLVLYFFTQGNLKTLWPSYRGYLNDNQNASLVELSRGIFNTGMSNFEVTFNRIVFSERAVDSLSKFKDGGLLSGPALCFVPFAIGFVLAGIRRERYFSLIVSVFVSLLPAILSGVPNARRLLLFLSLLLILPGITVCLLFDRIQRVLPEMIEKAAVLIPALFFFILFSYNLYIFIDIHNSMAKKNAVFVPFAESGFGDMTYSRYTTALAKEIREFIKNNNVFFYYSDVFHENPTAPNGTYEQFLIESYSNCKKGGKLVWMNPFHETLQGTLQGLLWSKPYFYKFETALNMILESARDVKVIFIKPLADEMIIYERLKAFFPHSTYEERRGDTNEDKFYILSIPHTEIDNFKNQKLVFSEFNSETMSRMIKENINSHFSFDGYFLLENDSKIQFKNNMTGLLEIYIDGFKLTEQTKSLSLSKGIHQVKIRPVHKEPFTAINVTLDKAQNFSAPFVTPSETMRLSKSNTTKLYPYVWTLEKSIPYNNPYFTHSFYYDKDNQFLYSYFYNLFNASGQSLILDDYRGGINKILQKDGKLFLSRNYFMDYGFLTVYDSSYKKIRDIEVKGQPPFDLFFGNAGELYVTYLKRDEVTIVQPDYEIKTWNSSSFSEFPIWNGDVDQNGDIVLLSGGGQVFVFDKNRNLYRSFNVDASWATNYELVRYSGGIIITNGIIHILDSIENSIKSYDKSGRRLYSVSDNSLFRIPPNFKIDFIQKLNDKIVLTGVGQPKEILIYRLQKTETQIRK